MSHPVTPKSVTPATKWSNSTYILMFLPPTLIVNVWQLLFKSIHFSNFYHMHACIFRHCTTAACLAELSAFRAMHDIFDILPGFSQAERALGWARALMTRACLISTGWKLYPTYLPSSLMFLQSSFPIPITESTHTQTHTHSRHMQVHNFFLARKKKLCAVDVTDS